MKLRDAVAEADLRVLLMCVFHLSGDRRWLEAPFRPRRDVRLIADEGAGLSPDAADEIRDAAIALEAVQPSIADPGDALMQRMMSVCLGESVPAEYAPMMREELGFCSREIAWTADAPPRGSDLDVLVVGAGASGIAMGVRLSQLGVPFSIVERESSVGGVWRDNRYPGCGVDTPNHAYSYSFTDPYPWSRYFSPREEIYEYLRRTARDYGVLARIETSTRVRRADWSEERRRWQVEVDGPKGAERRYPAVLVSAIGQLNEPSIPPLAGIHEFRGACFHTARWPDALDLQGKRVAVIGTGASAMQVVPAIAEEVGQLAVYQRSPQWARPIPRYHDAIPPGGQWLLEHMPFYVQWYRFTMMWRYGDGLLRSLRKDPDWPHPERSLNRANDRHRREMTEYLLRELGDRQDLIDKCQPDYPPYGKRILLDNGWYRTLRKPNVELVTEPVRRLTADGIVAADGVHRPADVVILATGFQVTEMTARLDITGRDGRNLRDVWAEGNPTAYLGITVPGFPNLFCLQGPNTGLGHGGSAIFQSECQARYVTGCLVAMAEAGAAAIDVRAAVHDDYVARVDAEHEKLIWTHPGMSTYYRNAHGRVVSVMPWRLVDYWAMTHRPELDDYRLVPR